MHLKTQELTTKTGLKWKIRIVYCYHDNTGTHRDIRHFKVPSAKEFFACFISIFHSKKLSNYKQIKFYEDFMLLVTKFTLAIMHSEYHHIGDQEISKMCIPGNVCYYKLD